MASISTDYDIIGFYIVFMLLLNFFVLGFSGSLVNGTDYLDKQQKDAISMDWGSSLAWVLVANAPSSSNVFYSLWAIRIIYIFIVFPYSILFIWTVVKLLRGVM
jgi:hypothetical protein